MYILSAALAWLTAQLLKILVEGWKNKKFDFKRLWGPGGMPSSHAAATVALTVSLIKDLGVKEPVVAVAVVFTAIVLYDAAGVRRETGKQAEVLNRIIDELLHHKHITDERLKELLGHTPSQVLMGSLLGFFYGFYL